MKEKTRRSWWHFRGVGCDEALLRRIVLMRYGQMGQSDNKVTVSVAPAATSAGAGACAGAADEEAEISPKPRPSFFRRDRLVSSIPQPVSPLRDSAGQRLVGLP